MSNWTGGYVASIDYTHGFYRELTPALLAFAAVAAGRKAPALDQRLHYCELGCGQGFSVNLLAATNPGIEFYATDFNPTQIMGAQDLAREAALTNAHFSDAAFDEYLEDPNLPQFDFIALHGIYSWVSAGNREALLRFLRQKLKPGGLVFISYNCLPGWAASMPLRRLLVEHAGTTGGSLASRIEQALTFATRLKDADFGYFRATRGVRERLEKLPDLARNYLAHEYFNDDWTPFYFGDVARDLDKAKLRFIASVHLMDMIDTANLTPAHAALLAEVSDPVARETLRDFATMQSFRRDLFGRGALALRPEELPDLWSSLRFALIRSWPGEPLKVTGALGEVSPQPEIYHPILDGLAAGARTVRELLQDPKIAVMGWPPLVEALKVLVGAGWAQPCLDAKGQAERAKRTKLFNAAVLRRAQFSQDLQHLASPVTGGGVSVDRFQQLFLLSGLEKHPDPPRQALAQLAAQGQSLMKDGRVLATEAENLEELQARYAAFQAALPLLRHLGVV